MYLMAMYLILIRHWERRVEAHESLPTHPVGLFNPLGMRIIPGYADPLPHPLGMRGGHFFVLYTLYVFHSDCLERAEGPRQAGANTRGPRRAE